VAGRSATGSRGEIRKNMEGQEDQLGAMGLVTNAVVGVRLENSKYPTLSLFFVQITSWVYGDS
jgi:hypothetical protein